MFVKNCLFTIWILSACLTVVTGQISIDTSVTFDEQILILSYRLEKFNKGFRTEKIGSEILKKYETRDLATVLSNETPVYIKSYGLGGLATSSFRGGSAAHTNIVWNGFQINNVTNGQIDLSLIPVTAFESAHLQYGGGAALWGCGAIGGSLLLESQNFRTKELKTFATLSGSSFNRWSQNVGFSDSRKKFKYYINLNNSIQENNFLFKSRLTGLKQRQQHAGLKQSGLLAGISFPFALNEAKINVWLNKTDRNIPPTLLQSVSVAEQQDRSARLSFELPIKLFRWRPKLKSGLFLESLQYRDSIVDINDKNKSLSWITEFDYERKIGKHFHMRAGLNHNLAIVKSPNYDNTKKVNRTALFYSLAHDWYEKRLHSSINLRQEIMNKKLQPFTWSIGSEKRLKKNWSIGGNLASVYRVPTLNDLFWTPGGNPELLPENGITADFLTKLSHVSKDYKFRYIGVVNIFYKDIKNWIIWLPRQNIWTPQNLLRVRSKGIETSHVLRYNLKDWSFKFNLRTNYVHSANIESKLTGDNSLDKQLIYVPMYTGGSGLSITYKYLEISYTQTYSGYTYTSNDHSAWINPYHLGSLDLRYSKYYTKHHFQLFIKLDNVWDAQYEVIQYRPMPGRMIEAGINYSFSKANSNEIND